jgi:hypothetical protein
MKRIRQTTKFARVVAKGRTANPLEVCEDLKLRPSDTLRYPVADDATLRDKATETGRDTFAVFSEWASEADEAAYRRL